jgi:hypothetical protein
MVSTAPQRLTWAGGESPSIFSLVKSLIRPHRVQTKWWCWSMFASYRDNPEPPHPVIQFVRVAHYAYIFPDRMDYDM